MNKTAGLINLSGRLCPDCGYIHPVPKDGICPMKNNSEQPNNNQHNVTTNNDISKYDIEFMKIKNDLNKLVQSKYKKLDFKNEYIEKKFFDNIRKLVLNDKLKEFVENFNC